MNAWDRPPWPWDGGGLRYLRAHGIGRLTAVTKLWALDFGVGFLSPVGAGPTETGVFAVKGGVNLVPHPGIWPDAPPGKDYALLIATDNYLSREWGSLNNPVFDAEAIANELRKTFGIEVPEVVIDPPQQRIYSALREYIGRQYSDADQLLVIFAGHGFYDENTKEGFLVASDSKAVSVDIHRTSFVPFSRLKDQLDAIPVKHLLVIIDACFGGAFAGTGGIRGSDDYAQVSVSELRQRKVAYRTRKYIASGGKVYVPDGRPGHHSPFAKRLRDALRSEGH